MKTNFYIIILLLSSISIFGCCDYNLLLFKKKETHLVKDIEIRALRVKCKGVRNHLIFNYKIPSQKFLITDSISFLISSEFAGQNKYKMVCRKYNLYVIDDKLNIIHDSILMNIRNYFEYNIKYFPLAEKNSNIFPDKNIYIYDDTYIIYIYNSKIYDKSIDFPLLILWYNGIVYVFERKHYLIPKKEDNKFPLDVLITVRNNKIQFNGNQGILNSGITVKHFETLYKRGYFNK